MKKLAFAIGLMTLGLGAATPASADYAVVKFNSGFCRVWVDTAGGAQDGRFLWYKGRYWHYRWSTYTRASRALAWSARWHRCAYW
jgi:hypothetical protein